MACILRLRSIAKIKVYSSQAGLKLVLDSTEEDFLIGMLISLSKLAVKSARLISGQVHIPLKAKNKFYASCYFFFYVK